MTTTPERTVVLAEDYAELRDILRVRLEAAGFEVYCTALVSEILPLVQQHMARWLILDLELKDGWSVDIPRKARELSWYVYIIVVTGHSEAYPLKQMIDAGADDYFSKNVDVGDLLAKIHRVRERQNHAAPRIAKIDFSTGTANLDEAVFVGAGGAVKSFNSNELRLVQKLWEHYPKPVPMESLLLYLFSVSDLQTEEGNQAHARYRKLVQSVRETIGFPDAIFYDRKNQSYCLKLEPAQSGPEGG